jgi:hypothetical protein
MPVLKLMQSHEPTTRGLPLHYIALAAALLPFITIHVSYLVAASAGHVEWCVPYWDSCTSISATGRQLPEKIWFKSGMIPAALATMLLWWCAADWRKRAAPTHHSVALAAMPLLGLIAACSLILYTAALGEEGGAFRLIRRAGIVLSFAFTFISQTLLTRLIGELAHLRADAWLQRRYHQLLALLLLLLTVGIVSVILDGMLGADYDRIEDAFEWVMALMLNLYFVMLAQVWRRERAVLTTSVAICRF